MSASPSKRRVLGDLDVNVSSPAPKASLGLSKPTVESSALKPEPQKHQLPTVAEEPGAEPGAEPAHKRSVDEKAVRQRPAKRACLDTEVKSEAPSFSAPAEEPYETSQDTTTTITTNMGTPTRLRSSSPAESSMFDSSGMDMTQATALTEPDVEGSPRPPIVAAAGTGPQSAPVPAPRRVPTREESRQKAEILRLRLSLAAYKLRTGQTDLPLEQLRIRPIAGSAAFGAPSITTTNTSLAPACVSSSFASSLASTASFNTCTTCSRTPLSPAQQQKHQHQHQQQQQQQQQQHRPAYHIPPRITAPTLHPSGSPSGGMDGSSDSEDERGGCADDGRRGPPPPPLPQRRPLPAGLSTTTGRYGPSLLPRLPPPHHQTPAAATPQQRRTRRGREEEEEDGDVDEQRLTSSALRGGAASGLLELRNSSQ